MIREFEDISIQHADVGPEGSWILLAATIPQSVEGLKPMKVTPARKLMGLVIFTCVSQLDIANTWMQCSILKAVNQSSERLSFFPGFYFIFPLTIFVQRSASVARRATCDNIWER
jgi:hypothetical protein